TPQLACQVRRAWRWLLDLIQLSETAVREEQILLLEESPMPNLWRSPQIFAGIRDKFLSFAHRGSSPTTSVLSFDRMERGIPTDRSVGHERSAGGERTRRGRTARRRRPRWSTTGALRGRAFGPLSSHAAFDPLPVDSSLILITE